MAVRIKPDRFLVDEHGKPEAVVLSLAAYRKLTRLAADRDDAATLRRAIRTSRGTLSHHQLTTRLKRQGLI